MLKKLLSVFAVLLSLTVVAQDNKSGTSVVKGKVVGTATNKPIGEIEVLMPELKLLTITDGEGNFFFSQVALGNYNVVVTNGYSIHDTVRVSVDQSVVDLGVIPVSLDEAAPSATAGQLPTIALEESSSSADDEGVSAQTISGVLTASRDPYLSAAAFTFGPLRYLIRGYSRDQLEVYMNGLQMNDVELGSAFFGQWGGLNDVFRNQSVVFGLQPGEDGFGGLIGSTGINATAAAQRQQTRITYSASNRTYRNRVMVTHSTGMMENGWALSVSASKRWAKEGYIPGTSYNGYSYYLGLSKKINSKSSIHLTSFGAPTVRGKAMPAVQEAMDLVGSNFYNPNWGYLNGEKRNARMNNTYQPVTILNYEYTPNNSTRINIAGAYQTGYNGNSALDWYNAWDPRPDYYKNLPSNFLNDPRGINMEAYEQAKEKWMNDPTTSQVNWNRLYEANAFNQQTINGVTGNRSVYVIGEDRDDIKKYNFAANIQKSLGEHVTLYGGLSYISQQTESYKKLLDLLGGDYYVNLNQFAERTYVGSNTLNQVDLNNPNRIVYEGDKYFYNYIARFNKAFGWAQAVFNYNKFDFFISGRLTNDNFSREGLYKNGLFVDDSYGKSEKLNFLTYQTKAGVTYKINGRNYLYVNGGLMTNAPTFDNSFISPRTRNAVVQNLQLEKIASVEGGYLLRTPRFNGRISAFSTNINDATVIKRFYYEGFTTFVNYVMTGVSYRHVGTELALQAKISPSLSANAVVALSQAFYNSRPLGVFFRDNDTNTAVLESISYIKNYYLAVGPQSAYTFGLNYRSPKYWYANINVNLMDRSYVDVNPSRMTAEAVDLIEPKSASWNSILEQEKLPAFYTVDIFAGKSFLLSKTMKFLPRNTFLYVNLGVNNVLNNRNIITSGFEQLRFDFNTGNSERFPAKYFYGYGANYFINLSLKF